MLYWYNTLFSCTDDEAKFMPPANHLHSTTPPTPPLWTAAPRSSNSLFLREVLEVLQCRTNDLTDSIRSRYTCLMHVITHAQHLEFPSPPVVMAEASSGSKSKATAPTFSMRMVTYGIRMKFPSVQNISCEQLEKWRAENPEDLVCLVGTWCWGEGLTVCPGL